MAMTTVNNILPPIAVAWYCIQRASHLRQGVLVTTMRWRWSSEWREGAGIGFGNSEIGSSGYGILPYMSAYRENRIPMLISARWKTMLKLKTPVKLRFPQWFRCAG
ncbi:hypothetical protein ACVXG7_01125 [Enterobacter hormaechei]